MVRCGPSNCVSVLCFSILVNSKSSIKRLQFAKVFWDYTAEAIQGAVVEKSTISPRKHPDHTAKVASPSQKVDDGITKEKVRAELPYHTCILCTPGKRQAQGKNALSEITNTF